MRVGVKTLHTIQYNTTISIVSIVKVNRERNFAEFRHYFGNITCNLAGYRKRLAEYTVRNLVTMLGLAYRIGVVEQCCQMV